MIESQFLCVPETTVSFSLLCFLIRKMAINKELWLLHFLITYCMKYYDTLLNTFRS